MMNEEVRKIMTKNPLVVSPETSIIDVSKMMVEKEVQQLPVVSEGKLVGLVTTYDLWKQQLQESTKEKSVKDIMTTNVCKLAPKDKVGTAAELFMDRRFKTLPVVNLRDELKGVVTSFDVMRYTLKKEYKTPILYKEILAGVN